MAFEGLTEKLSAAFKRLRGKGRLTEADVKEAMKEIRMALLEADVNFKVVKQFVAKVSERAVGTDVLESLTPAQMIVKIVNEELTALMGGESARLEIASKPPTVVMLVGLNGAGKTTNGAKLAGFMKKQGKRPLLVACDTFRPAAITQLEVVGSQVDVRLKSVDCRLREGELEVTVEACAQAVVRMEREVTLLSDVYSVSCRLDAQRSPCPLCTLAETGGTSQSVRHFYQTSVEVRQVLDSFAVVKEVTQRSGEHGSELAAQIQVHMLYLDEEGELRGASDSVLVTCPYQIPEGCQRKVHCRAVGDLTATAVSGGIDLRFELEFRWLTTKEEELLCVSSVASTGAYEGPCSRPSLVIRRVDAGEQLWDVAKACGATIQDICTANELASETVPEGMVLLIPTKRV